MDRHLGCARSRAVAQHLSSEERLPGFPIWLHHFGDFQTLDGARKYVAAQERLHGEVPAWKRSHLMKNGEWFERFDEVIEVYWPLISSFPLSRQKFEWQAGPHRPLAKTIMHFRPSGIRCKRPDYVPALVAITQTSVLGDRRRLTPRETARLQGLPDWFEFAQSDPARDVSVPQKDSASYKQVGNGVNVGAAYHVFRKYIMAEHVRNDIPSHVLAAVEFAGSDPDIQLGMSWACATWASSW